MSDCLWKVSDDLKKVSDSLWKLLNSLWIFLLLVMLFCIKAHHSPSLLTKNHSVSSFVLKALGKKGVSSTFPQHNFLFLKLVVDENVSGVLLAPQWAVMGIEEGSDVSCNTLS